MTKIFGLLLGLGLLLMSPAVEAETYCVKDLPDYAPVKFVYPEGLKDEERVDLPAYGVKAFFKSDELYFEDPKIGVYLVRWFNPTDDGGGWEGIHPLADGSLYLSGVHYKYAIGLSRGPDGHWRVKRVVFFFEHPGVFLAWLYAVTGLEKSYLQRLGADEWVTYDQRHRPRVEPVTGSVIFWGTGLEWRKGKKRPVGGRKDLELRLIGGLPHLKAALFKSTKEQLYSYSGGVLRPVAGGDVSADIRALKQAYPGAYLGRVDDRQASGRSFYLLKTANFELVPEGQGLRLKRLPIPPEPDMFFTRFVPMPGNGDVMVFTRRRVYRLSDMQPLYGRLALDAPINTAGRDNYPMSDAKRGGIIFSTGGTAKTDYFHILKPCGQKTGSVK